MSKREPSLLVIDILNALQAIEEYTSGMNYETFVSDKKTVDAVIRNLLVIGEAANRFSENFRIEHTEIKWASIIGMRHKLIHDYEGISHEIVWETVQINLPELKQQLSKIKLNS